MNLSMRTVSAAGARAMRGLAFAFVAALFVTPPARAGIDGISYTFQPTYHYIQWNENLGLKDTEMIGGRVGINFGRYVSLMPYYVVRQNVATDFASIHAPNSTWPVLPEGKVDLRNYGGDVVLNLGGRNIVPFLRGGAGVMEFTPDNSGREIQQINVKGGGGLRFGVSRFMVEVYAEDSAFRLDRLQLAGLSTSPEPEATRVRHNLGFGAGLNLKLGGYDEGGLSETDRAVSERYRRGLAGLSIPLEPFVGKLDFDDDLQLTTQNMAGLRAGLDLGPYVGLRGFYWRGVTDDFDGTDPMQGYGGEARFNLGSGTGVIPYVTLGAGQIDFMDEYRDEANNARADKSVLILGGGVAFSISDRFRINAGARDNLFTEKNLDDVASVDELKSNWLLSVGLGFNLFGDGRPGATAQGRGAAENVTPLTPEQAVAVAAAEDRGTAEDRVAVAGVTPAEAAEIAAAESGDYVSRKTVTIPVPKEGEIYIRYGRPGAGQVQTVAPGVGGPLTEEALRSAVREELTRAQPQGYAGLTSDQQMELLERRILEKLDQRLATLTAAPPPGVPPVTPAPTETKVVGEAGADVRHPVDDYSMGFRGLRGYVGLGLNGTKPFVVGGRVNLGGFSRGSKLTFLPEFALGYADDADSWLAAANMQLDLRRTDEFRRLGCYAYAGGGLLRTNYDAGDDRTQFVVNAGVGAEYRVTDALPLFVEYQGLKLFAENRLLFGIRVKQ